MNCHGTCERCQAEKNRAARAVRDPVTPYQRRLARRVAEQAALTRLRSARRAPPPKVIGRPVLGARGRR